MSVSAETSLQLALRRLWSDHVIWTREYVVAAIANAPGAQAVAGRLLANQEHIGASIVPFYGEQAGKALTGLLKQHIMVAVDLIEAAKAGDGAKFADADQRWDDNAREIAALLSSANPNWSGHDVVDLLRQHMKLTKDEVTARLERRWEDDIEAFDQIFTEILTVADALHAGIVKQFTDRFGQDRRRHVRWSRRQAAPLRTRRPSTRRRVRPGDDLASEARSRLVVTGQVRHDGLVAGAG